MIAVFQRLFPFIILNKKRALYLVVSVNFLHEIFFFIKHWIIG